MKRLRDFWNWLCGEPAKPAQPVLIYQVGLATEEHEADWRAGYSVGRAQGEIEGRQALALELEREFGVGQDPMTADDARRIKIRQVH